MGFLLSWLLLADLALLAWPLVYFLVPPTLLLLFFFLLFLFLFLPYFSEHKVSTLRPGDSFLEIFTLVLLEACLLVWTLVTRYTHIH